MFKAQPNDIILCSAPKTGTTWLKALAVAIANRAFLDNKLSNPLISSFPHECIPYLEVDPLEHKKSLYPQIPLMATHIPYSFLPPSVLSSRTKLVYICRDPKDVFVSWWYFIGPMKGFSIEETFELFCKGISHTGPYWDHVLEYWNASSVNPGRVLFLKYEDLKKEPLFHVKKLAEFIGFPFSLEEESDGVVQKSVEFCSFKNLSNLEVNKIGKYSFLTTMEPEKKIFFRKGDVGDWRNFLSDEMVERMDKITRLKMKDYGFAFG